MTAYLKLYDTLVFWTEEYVAPAVMPLLARFLFAAIYLMYFWNSALTKLGGSVMGLFSPSFNAFAQIFPKGAEAAGYDIAQATLFQKAVILAGTWGEFILPALIVLGLFTRLSAIGMIGFMVILTLTDLYGHGLINDPKTIGAWFDGAPDSIVMDQRVLFIFLMLVLVMRGGGPLSLDWFLRKKRNSM